MKFDAKNSDVFEMKSSSKNRGALATIIFKMQEWNFCDTHKELAIGILYSTTWNQIDVKKEI
jgi:hypothetical protein